MRLKLGTQPILARCFCNHQSLRAYTSISGVLTRWWWKCPPRVTALARTLGDSSYHQSYVSKFPENISVFHWPRMEAIYDSHQKKAHERLSGPWHCRVRCVDLYWCKQRRSLVEISLASEWYYFLTFEGQYKTITELNHIMFFSIRLRDWSH